MTNQQENSTDGVVSLLAGVAVGVLIGGAVGLLMAPQPGRQTRDRLRESADEAVDWLSHAVEDLRHNVEELAQSIRAGQGGSTADGSVAAPADSSL